jgi:hypothetical protein
METLDKHFRKLTQPLFKKHGFAQGDVLASWPQIVGNTMAAICRPERIRWPRGSDETQGGTLHLKAQMGRSLDVQYATPQIIEKVNQFLGFSAISAVKVTQGPLPTAEPHITATTQVDLPQLETVKDSDLKSALARLGSGVLAQNPRSPQAKKPVA